jgi:hypothetical protein
MGFNLFGKKLPTTGSMGVLRTQFISVIKSGLSLLVSQTGNVCIISLQFGPDTLFFLVATISTK